MEFGVWSNEDGFWLGFFSKGVICFFYFFFVFDMIVGWVLVLSFLSLVIVVFVWLGG